MVRCGPAARRLGACAGRARRRLRRDGAGPPRRRLHHDHDARLLPAAARLHRRRDAGEPRRTARARPTSRPSRRRRACPRSGISASQSSSLSASSLSAQGSGRKRAPAATRRRRRIAPPTRNELVGQPLRGRASTSTRRRRIACTGSVVGDRRAQRELDRAHPAAHLGRHDDRRGGRRDGSRTARTQGCATVGPLPIDQSAVLAPGSYVLEASTAGNAVAVLLRHQLLSTRVDRRVRGELSCRSAGARARRARAARALVGSPPRRSWRRRARDPLEQPARRRRPRALVVEQLAQLARISSGVSLREVLHAGPSRRPCRAARRAARRAPRTSA